MTIYFKTINVGTVSASGTVSKSWSADDDYTLKKIIAVEKGNSGLHNVTATMRIENFTFTKDNIPLSVMQNNIQYVPDLEYLFKKGQTFYVSITNNGTSDVEIFLVLVLEK